MPEPGERAALGADCDFTETPGKVGRVERGIIELLRQDEKRSKIWDN